MVIIVNEEKKSVPDGLALSSLFGELGLQGPLKGIAIAINDQIVLQKKWESTVLQENDKVLIISATKGG
ncbi:sulfur carrier protein ThiS [Plebeiibacterium marinum]|uniref:Sulfur carrier protein ThiS n=1 Tax=Plebeiibacterium marinum TaxID=2992111 RepID=A0AAE3MGP9_9BACT|nr:sulfur carrier protein ThiS [Plebeiobacterium marinum]MCW3807401.1 sulfur carrier protein ThiS [Plebeiobacterium marinum]